MNSVTLSTAHRQTLETESGIAPAVVAARGYWTAQTQGDLEALGFAPRQRRVPALVIPQWGVTGEVALHQIRPDIPRQDNRGRELKYEVPLHSTPALDVPPSLRPYLGDPAIPLLITEGAKKVDALASRWTPSDPFCAINIGGVWLWRGNNGQGGKTVLPDWDEVALNGRRVYLAFDGDVAIKRSVHAALERLKSVLERRGATVFAIYLPATLDGAKCGVDDYLVAGHQVSELVALAQSTLRAAPEGAEPSPALKVPAKAGASLFVSLLLPSYGPCYAYDEGAATWRRYSAEAGVWEALPESKFRGQLSASLEAFPALDRGFSWRFLSDCEQFLRIALARDFPLSPQGWLPLQNGALDLATGELHPHTPERGFTWLLNYGWDPLSECPRTLEFLAESVGGDQDQVDVLRAFLKAVLTGRTDLHRYLELLGPGGTGKSTFVRLAQGICGRRNSVVLELKYLEASRFETAALSGKRLAVITDSERYAGPVSTLKAITGGDAVRVERKYRQPSAPMVPEALIIVAANEPIQSADYTSGLERRRLTMTFRHRPASPKDLMTHSGEGFSGELAPELPGVLRWVLGLPEDRMVTLVRDTLAAVPSLREDWEQVIQATNPLADWASEALVADPSSRTQIGLARRVQIGNWAGERVEGYLHSEDWLYPNYALWCSQSGSRPLAQRRFSNLLVDLLESQWAIPEIRILRVKQGRFLCGVRLRAEGEVGLAEKNTENVFPREESFSILPTLPAPPSGSPVITKTCGKSLPAPCQHLADTASTLPTPDLGSDTGDTRIPAGSGRQVGGPAQPEPNPDTDAQTLSNLFLAGGGTCPHQWHYSPEDEIEWCFLCAQTR